MPDACCIGGLSPSPAGDRVAYVTYGADPPVTPEQRAVTGVRVIDGSGREVEWFPNCYAPRWSRDGTRLAMIEGQYPETIGRLSPVAVRVVERSGRSRAHGYQPRSIAWGNGDTLFLEYEDRVDALDVEGSKSWRTTYIGCEVSPDGQYSFLSQGPLGLLRVQENQGGLELGRCVLSRLGPDREPFLFGPFWIRSAARGHLLCFSMRPSNQSPPSQASSRTVVIDTRTMEVVNEWPGKLVRPSSDHRSLVLLRGDTLDLVECPTWRSEPPRQLIGWIHMQVYGWGMHERAGSPTSNLVSDSTYAVAVGDWVSSSRAHLGECGRIIRVLRAPDAAHVDVEIATSMIGPLQPGAGPAPTPWEMLSSGARVTLGWAPVTLRTPSVDGGYDVVLSFVQ
jgi:hypothetical protein